jgi:hypothetical protein
MADDWHVMDVQVGGGFVFGLTSQGQTFFTALVGSRDTQDAVESSDGATEFNVPWGIQDGFKPHRVWLYLPEGVKGGPRVRKKLAQYVGAPGSAQDDVRALKQWLKWENRPPWIHVQSEPQQYIFGVGFSYLSELADRLGDAIYHSIGRKVWEA